MGSCTDTDIDPIFLCVRNRRKARNKVCELYNVVKINK